MKPLVHEARRRLRGLVVLLAGFRALLARCGSSWTASRGALLGLTLCSWTACERGDAPLMHVTRVDQDEEAGLMFVHGEGFFAGAKCTATLRGTLFQPLGMRSHLTRTWPCRARSERQVDVTLESSANQRAGLLEGSLELSFAGAASERSFVARSALPVRVRIVDTTLAQQLTQSRAARAFAQEIGVALEPHARGLVVTEVSEAGRAARAGLRARDVIERLDGAPVERTIDLVPSPRVSAPVLEVSRGESSLSIAIPRQGAVESVMFSPLHALVFAIAFLGVLLVPLATPNLRREARRLLDLCVGDWRALTLGAALTLANASVFAAGGLDLRCAFFAPWLMLVALQLLQGGGTLRIRVLGLGPLLRVALGVGCLALLAEDGARFPLAASSLWLLACVPPSWLAAASLRAGLPVYDAQQALSGRVTWSWLVTTSAWSIAAFALHAQPTWLESAGATRAVVLVAESVLVAAWLMLPPARYWPTLRWVWPLLAVATTAGWLLLAPSATLSALIGYGAMGAAAALGIKQVADRKQRTALRRPDPMLEPFR